jgi:hypothetical protein
MELSDGVVLCMVCGFRDHPGCAVQRERMRVGDDCPSYKEVQR